MPSTASRTRKGKNSGSDSRFLNHRWDLPETLARIGWIEKEEIEELSNGRLSERVPVDINRAIFDYDQIIVLGPVFPHEVVGYSGGAKYLFPGISGGEFLHAFHWLGAIVTCPGTIGIKHTPVREVINRAMRFVEVPVHCLAMVVKSATELYGLFGGDYRAGLVAGRRSFRAGARGGERKALPYRFRHLPADV